MHIGKFLSRFSAFGPPKHLVAGKPSRPDPIELKRAGDEHGGTILFGSGVHWRALNMEMPEQYEKHKVVLDIDHPAALFESSSGNFHLFIDKELTREQYKKLVDVMAEIGLLNQFHAKHFDEKKGTYVFAPWVDKAPYNCDSSKPGEI